MPSQIGSLIEWRQPAFPSFGTPIPGQPPFPQPGPRCFGSPPVERQTSASERRSGFMPSAIGDSTFFEEASPAWGGLVSDRRHVLRRMPRVAAAGRVLTVGLGPWSRETSTPELLSELMKTPVAHGESAAWQTRTLPMASVIWSLVERQQVGAARQLLSSLPDALEYRRLRSLLRRPRTWSAPRRDRERSADFRWLRQHSRDYVGRWVALAGGNLLAEADSLHALRSQLRQGAPQARPLIHFIR